MGAVVDRCDTFTISYIEDCGSVSGSYGYGAIRLDAHNIGVYMCITTNGTVYMCPYSGYLSWHGSGLSHYNSWPLRMVGAPYSFQDIYVGGEPRDLYTPIILWDCSSASYTSCYYYFDDFYHPKPGDTLSDGWAGFNCKSTIDDWQIVDGNPRKRAYYVAFPAHNRGGNVNALPFDSARIIFESDIFEPDYYPGEIFQTSSWSTAKSCNRKASGNNVSGYFKKYTSTFTLSDCKNRSNDKSNSTVLIHDGSGWNIVAPKIGGE